jgi:transcriptional regulator with XRE-family HTH domain
MLAPEFFYAGDMTAKQVVLAEYLRARRSALKPEDVGYPADPQRRVRGLRREEVAERAGISLEYYVRLEQGQNHRISEQVLDALRSYQGAVVLVTHDPGAAEALDPQRVVLLPDGTEDYWSDDYRDLIELA